MGDVLTFGSLFAGIDGLGLGLERSGMKCCWQVEIDAHARRVLEKNWPDVPKWDDVRTFPPSSGDWSVDCIAGGFPCQGFSWMGQGEGFGHHESGLWGEFVRIIRVLRPRVVVVENVPAILARGLGRVLGDLSECGMDAEWTTVSSCAFGGPHMRFRVCVVAYAKEIERLHKPIIWEGSSRLPDNATLRRANPWDETKSRVCRVDDGIPDRVDRFERLGNAVDPRWAEFIGRMIVDSVTQAP